MHHNELDLAGMACACTSLRKASRAVTRFYDDAMAGTNLSIAQFGTLRNIARHEPCPLMKLSEVLVMDRTTLYRTLKPLAREGWVQIESGAGRAKTVRLSATGRKAVLAATGAWEAAQRRFLQSVGSKHWQEVENALGRVITAVQEEAR